MKKLTLHTIAGLIGLATLGIGVFAYHHLNEHWCLHPLQNGLTRPLLAMELVRGRDDVRTVLGENCRDCSPPCVDPVQENKREMASQQSIDRVFIPFYAAFLCFAAIIGLRRTGAQWQRALMRVTAAAAILWALLAAGHDYLEDARIDTVLKSYSSINDAMAQAIRNVGYPKWGFLFAAVLCLWFVFWDLSIRSVLLKIIGGLTAALALIAGVWGLVACYHRDDVSVEAAAAVVFLLFGLATVYFLLYSWLADGTLPAFNSLAQLPPFNRLAKWPPSSGKNRDAVPRQLHQPRPELPILY